MPAAVNSSVRSGESRGALGSLRWSCPSKNRRKPSRISAEFTFHLTQYRSYEVPAHEDSIPSAPREARTTVSLLPPKVVDPVSYTHLRAHETRHDLVCRLLLEKK